MDMSAPELFQSLTLRDHCTATVKMTPDGSDLLLAHTTWGRYKRMLRVMKTYRMPLYGVAASGVMFPGYYGTLISGDDIYLTDETRLALVETTNSNCNDKLYDLISPKTVLNWQRVIIAFRLAKSAPEWVSLFGRHQSGTYNNQWMAVDFKLFRPGSSIQPNTLWVYESAPGITASADMSRELEISHWPSFNRPYFPEIYNVMGYAEVTAKYGDMFS